MTTEPAAPDILGRWLAPFEALFTGPTWRNLLVLLAGAILAPGRRTVTSALSILGLRAVTGFTNFHRVLNRNRWSSRAAAKRLLHLLLGAFVPDGPVIIGIDETIERRWGAKIKARGIYRDPVRSSRGHFVLAALAPRALATDRLRRWPAACAGFRSCCSPRSLGLVGSGPCRS